MNEPKCFIPEENTPYPLCIGGKNEECEICQLCVDWEPDDPYDVEGSRYVKTST